MWKLLRGEISGVVESLTLRAGAISQRHLKLPSGVTAFDYRSISDVILHLRYRAREGGDQLRSDAMANLEARINSMLVSLKDTRLTRLFSVRHEFPNEWYAFLNSAMGTDQVLTLNLTRDRFPYFAAVAPGLKVKSLELVADSTLTSIKAIQATPAPPSPPTLNFTNDGYYGTMPRLILDYSTNKKDTGIWTITNPKTNATLSSSQINDLLLTAHYEVTLVQEQFPKKYGGSLGRALNRTRQVIVNKSFSTCDNGESVTLSPSPSPGVAQYHSGIGIFVVLGKRACSCKSRHRTLRLSAPAFFTCRDDLRFPL